MIETKIGLPNTCCKCGKNPGETWFAPHVDAARSGHGFCHACAFRPADAKADPAKDPRKPAETTKPPAVPPESGADAHAPSTPPTPPAMTERAPAGKAEKPKRETKPKAEKKSSELKP